VTFSTSLGQKDVIRSFIVKVMLKDGSFGFGECPTSFALKEETIPAITGILKEVSPRLVGMPIDEYEQQIGPLRAAYPSNPMTISGLEVALFRAWLLSRQISEHIYWGGHNVQIETDLTIPFVPESGALQRWIEGGIRKGFSSFKIKVSGRVDEDERFVAAVNELLRGMGKGFTLRLDGNQGYTVKTFRQVTAFLEKRRYPVELFEQPLGKGDFMGMKEVKGTSPFPIILDETILSAADAQRAIEEDLCHGINIKIAKSGITESAKILTLARKEGLKTMIGCMTETMTGLSAAIHLAAGTGAFDFIDLDSIHFLSHRKRYNGILIDGPRFVISGDTLTTKRPCRRGGVA
jgi:L-alanine-DL-glutamate epimerase-like enolase superfamily enzyme